MYITIFQVNLSNKISPGYKTQADLIDQLIDDGYEFVGTTRFQSDPIERHFSQYQQMSGGRFLVSLSEV